MQLPEFLTRDAHGWIHVSGHRVGLNHVVPFYKEGESPEMLWERFPTLPLPVIHKLIAFYLENRAEVDGYIAAERAEVTRQAAAASRGPSLAELRARLREPHEPEASARPSRKSAMTLGPERTASAAAERPR